MSTKVGSIHYELDLDDDSYNKKADKASSKFSSLGNSIAGVGAGIAKATGAAILAAGTAVIGITTASVKAYADYEQFTGGVAKLFGDSADTVIKNAKAAYQTAGMDANSYMDTVTGFSARLLQSLGGDTVKAAEMADIAIKDMSDNANTFGTDIESIKNTYQGLAKANYTMLDNLKLGFGGTASEMARMVNETGVMGEGFVATANNINSVGFDKLIEAIHKTQESLKITGTTSKEASATITGSLNATKAAWTNLLTSLATGNTETISESIKGLAESVGNAFKNISALIPQILSGLVSVIEEISTMDMSGFITGIIGQIPRIIELAVTLVKALVSGIISNLPLLIESALSVMNTLIAGILELLPEILQAGITILISLITGIAEALPTLIPAIVDIIFLMVDIIIENLPLIIESGLVLIIALVQGLIEALPKLVGYIPTIIQSLVSALMTGLPMLIVAGLRIILELSKGLVVAIPQLVAMIPQIIMAITQGIVGGLNKFVQAGGSLIMGLWEGMKNYTQWIKDKLRAWIGDVTKFIKRLFGISSPSKLMEKEVGFNLGAGIANGITKSVDLVENAMGLIGRTVEASISPIIDPTVNMAEIPSIMQGIGLNELQDSSEGGKTINQDIDINIGKISDNQDLNALANQLGFRASLLPI